MVIPIYAGCAIRNTLGDKFNLSSAVCPDLNSEIMQICQNCARFQIEVLLFGREIQACAESFGQAHTRGHCTITRPSRNPDSNPKHDSDPRLSHFDNIA